MPLYPLDFTTILARVSALAGISELLPDADGCCELVIDGKFSVMLGFDGNDNSLVLFSSLGTLPDKGPEVLRRLLQANNFWKDTGGIATLSLNDAGDTIILAHRMRVYEEDPDTLRATLEKFINVAEAWIGSMHDLPLSHAGVSELAEAMSGGMVKV